MFLSLSPRPIIPQNPFHVPPRSSSNSRSLQIRSDLAATLAHPLLLRQLDAVLSLKSAPPPTARAVVHRAIIADCQNARRGTASTLTRAEVSSGSKKPYQQKKDCPHAPGIPAHPLRPGGGVIFCCKPTDWSIKINGKEKRLSISIAIAIAAASEDALVVEDFEEVFVKGSKMKEFIAAMKRWGKDPKEKAMFFYDEGFG